MSSKGGNLFSILNTIFLIALTLATLYPMWREAAVSFSGMEEAMKGGLFLWPRDFTTDAYVNILHSRYLWLAYGNSLFITVVGTFIGVFLTAATAFPLIKQDLPGKKWFVLLILFTMLFSGGIIPTYLLVKSVGLINSLWSLILPTAISAYNVIVMMSFFRTLPRELDESATMDGAHAIRIFGSVILPLSKPVLATIALWEAVGYWNNYLQALFYLNDKSKYVLPVLLRDIINGQTIAQMTGESTGSSTESVIAATTIMAVLPILIVYPFLQKYFVQGTLIGSVKA
ncbi:carbohydrate ABC transporter permease [Paenibacillus anseongense]|uniref:carbohydrate ABC transporter permease n=1 Tax=Paenibacillus TaxID=44249 RepID=UPI002DBEB541|nr:carbohydrate ABC transporter permease [Paenibacillus anseongense]MEC0268571.1 carbohydrate ABC transporter permease [Paenibacillus anseongense]